MYICLTGTKKRNIILFSKFLRNFFINVYAHHVNKVTYDIKEIRTRHGLNQAEFAEKLGITRELVGQMERGKKNISKATQVLLRNFLRENEVPPTAKNSANDPITVTTDLSSELGEIREILIGLQAQGKVDAMLLLEVRSRALRTVYASEAQKREELIRKEAQTLLAELRKKYG